MTASAQTELAILGAGPIGLEAALAAAEAGIPFVLLERGDRIAHSLRSWGHVRLFSPWGLDVSPRQRAALARIAQEPPTGDECPTGDELVERVLEPIARLPEIAEHLRLGTEVVAIGREGLLKPIEIGSPVRARARFRLLLEGADGETVIWATSVLDCTGSYEHPGWIGNGGIPAPGEREAAERIVRRLPDFDREAAGWSGRRILLVGAGHSAQTAAVALSEIARQEPATHIEWILRRRVPAIVPDPADPLPERRRLHQAARALIEGSCPCFTIHLGTTVDGLRQKTGGGLRVELRSDSGSSVSIVDRVLALVGSHGDRDLYAELQVHECYATSGPMKLAAQLLASVSADCLTQESTGADSLVTPEAGFFLLGSKSYGRNSSFLLRTGWQQVEDAIQLVASRRDEASRIAQLAER